MNEERWVSIEEVNSELAKSEAGYWKEVKLAEAIQDFDPRDYTTKLEYYYPEGWEKNEVEDDGSIIYEDWEEYELNCRLMADEEEDGEEGQWFQPVDREMQMAEDNGTVVDDDEDEINKRLEVEEGEDNAAADDSTNYDLTYEEFIDWWDEERNWRRERVTILPGLWLADVWVKNDRYYYQYIRVRRRTGIVINYPVVGGEVRNPREVRNPKNGRSIYPRIDNLAEEVLGGHGMPEERRTPDELLETLRRKRRNF